MNRSIAYIFVALIPLWGGELLAQGLTSCKIIVHPSNPTSSMSKSRAVKLFLKKESRWSNGAMVLPVDHNYTSSVRKAFTKEVHGKSVSAIKSYWSKQIFSGRGVPPPMKDSNRAVISFVLKNPGAIGYVSSSAETGKAKVLEVGD